MLTVKCSTLARTALISSALCALALTGCKNGGRGKSQAAQWVDSPSSGSKKGQVITFNQLGVKFEIPDTLYVYKECGEASHVPEGSQRWIPVITCSSTAGGEFEFGSEEEEEAWEEDPFAEEESYEEGGAEAVDVTIYVTHKTRPLDERAVTWFENQYKQAGLDVDEISYQHNFQKKAGIYAKLYTLDGDGEPSREIVQFLFPRKDVVFIARMEYPFGETRSVDKD